MVDEDRFARLHVWRAERTRSPASAWSDIVMTPCLAPHCQSPVGARHAAWGMPMPSRLVRRSAEAAGGLGARGGGGGAEERATRGVSPPAELDPETQSGEVLADADDLLVLAVARCRRGRIWQARDGRRGLALTATRRLAGGRGALGAVRPEARLISGQAPHHAQ